jgi:hypothetical protein
MANEITKTVYLKSSKNGGGVDSANGASPTKNITQAGSDAGKFTQTITQAADVALAVPAAVGNPCHLLVENLDPTNYIELSTGTGGSFAGARFTTVDPLDRVIIKTIGTVYGKANTADCLAQMTAVKP